MTFEGWKYQWCHELALMIDNDQELLRKMRELVSNIMEMEYSRAWAIVDLKRGVWNKLEIDLDCSTQLDGWAELLEYYEAQVLEARKYEASN